MSSFFDFGSIVCVMVSCVRVFLFFFFGTAVVIGVDTVTGVHSVSDNLYTPCVVVVILILWLLLLLLLLPLMLGEDVLFVGEVRYMAAVVDLAAALIGELAFLTINAGLGISIVFD